MEKLTQALNKEERGLFWADRDIWLRGTLAYAAWRGADLGAEWAKPIPAYLLMRSRASEA